MASTRFDPFRDFTRLGEEMNRLFGDVYRWDESVSKRGEWTPLVDIYETDDHDLVIKAELPDMSREDIEVTVENNTLSVRGNRKVPGDVKEEQFRRVERRYGTFNRSFALPNTVDPTKVSADYKNGVLTITLPFREEAKPRTINVEVAA